MVVNGTDVLPCLQSACMMVSGGNPGNGLRCDMCMMVSGGNAGNWQLATDTGVTCVHDGKH